jgi:hypothetical protein
MMNMTVNINRLDTAPDTMPWWRTMDTKTDEQRKAIERFRSNGTADYKQLAAGLEGVLNQYQQLADYTNRITTTEVYSDDVSGFGVSNVEYEALITHTFRVPPGKNRVSVVGQFDVNPNSGQSIYVINAVSVGGVYYHQAYAYCNGQAASFVSTSISWTPVPNGQYDIKYLVRMDSTPVNATPNNVANCNSFITFSKV